MKARADEISVRSVAAAPRARQTWDAALPLGLALAAGVAYAAISIYRHDHFGSGAFDLGVQDQTVWGYSQLAIIPNTVEMIGNLLGDHFHPILMTVAPLYWIWNDARVLLVVQAALLAAAGIPIFWWARTQLGLAAAIAVEIAYLIFWGILSGVVFDFHHIAFAVPALSFALYAVLTRNNRLFWAMLVVALLTRENVALTFAALGLYLIVAQRRWQLGLTVMAVCIAWFVTVVEVIMPAIAGTPYRHWTYDALGNGPGSAFAYVVAHPIASLELLFNNRIKLKLWGGLLGAWLLLPIASPIFLVAIPSLLERLWSSNPALWSASFDYSMLIAPILAFASIDTLRRFRPLVSGRVSPHAVVAVAAGIVLAGGIVTFALVQPLAELGTYISAGQVAAIQSCLNVIPTTASVSASNALLPHLSHRRAIYLLTLRTDADVIAIDLAAYRNQFFPGEQAQIRATIQRALAGGYGVACSTGTTVVLQLGGGTQALSPELAAFMAAP
jgi:uncharacterized membrane protein